MCSPHAGGRWVYQKPPPSFVNGHVPCSPHVRRHDTGMQPFPPPSLCGGDSASFYLFHRTLPVRTMSCEGDRTIVLCAVVHKAAHSAMCMLLDLGCVSCVFGCFCRVTLFLPRACSCLLLLAPACSHDAAYDRSTPTQIRAYVFAWKQFANVLCMALAFWRRPQNLRFVR